MKNRTALLAAVIAIAILFSVSAQSNWWPFSSDDDSADSQGLLTELEWDDLIPEDFVPPENPYMTMTQEEIDKLLDGSEESNAKMARLEKEFNYAPTVPTLNGIRVRIPAYVTPLEYDGQSEAKEFLLVPYVGACMHTPPPPANQIVHALSKKTMKIPAMRDAVWATGIIRTDKVKSILAESGYSMEIEKLTPYIPPQQQ